VDQAAVGLLEGQKLRNIWIGRREREYRGKERWLEPIELCGSVYRIVGPWNISIERVFFECEASFGPSWRQPYVRLLPVTSSGMWPLVQTIPRYVGFPSHGFQLAGLKTPSGQLQAPSVCGRCDIPSQVFNMCDRIFISLRYIFFFRRPTIKNFEVKCV
jgi:hypothetical protein